MESFFYGIVLISSSCSIAVLINKIFNKPKLFNNEWQPIETCPDEGNILITDGYTVDDQFTRKYTKNGNAVFGYNNKLATHWMPYPAPPIKDRS